MINCFGVLKFLCQQMTCNITVCKKTLFNDRNCHCDVRTRFSSKRNIVPEFNCRKKRLYLNIKNGDFLSQHLLGIIPIKMQIQISRALLSKSA